MILGNAVADRYMPCNGGLKAAMGCRWRRRVIGDCRCIFLGAL